MAIGEKSKMYQKNPEVSLEFLAQGIEQYLIQNEDMVCQMFQTPGGISIQTKKKEDWKKYIMLDNALQINLNETEQLVSVQIGGGKWVSKAAAAGVGAFLVWPIGIPMMALSAIGGLGTFKLPEKILTFIDQFMMSNGQCIMIPPNGGYGQQYQQYGQQYGQTQQYQPYQTGKFQQNPNYYNPQPYSPMTQPYSHPQENIECPHCHAKTSKSGKFCSECGGKLTE